MEADNYKTIALALLEALENEHKAYMALINMLNKLKLTETQPENIDYDTFVKTVKELLAA